MKIRKYKTMRELDLENQLNFERFVEIVMNFAEKNSELAELIGDYIDEEGDSFEEEHGCLFSVMY